MKTLVAGAALAALVASPAFAQFYGPPPYYGWGIYQDHSTGGARYVPDRRNMRGAYEAHGAVTPFGSPHVRMTPARAADIHRCSLRAAQYKEYTWGVMEVQQYRACMAEDGQVE
jgi:hypothetical protein